MSMFKFLLLLLFVPRKSFGKREALLEYENTVDDTKYTFRYKTNSGVVREEFGEMMNPGTTDQNYVVRGRTVNFFPDGSLQIVEYVADKYGYRPKITFLTSQQLRKGDLGSGETIRKPLPKVPQNSSIRIDNGKKTEQTAKPELTTDSVPPSNPVGGKNQVRVSPINAANRRKASFGYKENSSIRVDTTKKNEQTAKPELTTDNFPPSNLVGGKNQVRVSPISATNRTKASFDYKEKVLTTKISEGLNDDYDYDDIQNRIGGGTAAALLGIG